jgi:hypothetical protein
VELATGLAQNLAQSWFEVEPFGGLIELLLRYMPWVNGRRGSLGGHLSRDPPTGSNIRSGPRAQWAPF